ncbi:hypothetical protein PC116_g17074 [Phytophthora cactorum]|uniref:Uncharacterized protein n=1 Tax=Phytophthora cactorum TaxID=29920 RepID=A0A329RVA6_9STRA|nr:hypothetical protein PC111_g20781 [Phytophthora cactorum]KAG2798695.1 hypothetical protein PC112_g21238 [Phytophthora cactorum]KAG2854561.1 hypothetical protein PC113_g13206 [Phytophthora cactorum]KAG2962937.1 hypothetical protein PC118_g21154 [Phytophthora cactorum]KAG3157530.1 hypothetical protein C6341_g14703 [Phytophthora cactorum]
MTNFVKGGLLAKAELDTLELTAASNPQIESTTAVTSYKRKSREALESMASSFKTYAMDRRDEAGRGSCSSKLQQRSQNLSMMADIRSQIADVDGKRARYEGAESAEVQMLAEDRSILMEERQKLIKQLRETDI